MPPPDLTHPQQCLGANLRRTVRAVNQFYDHVMHVPDGQTTQFTLLAAINGFGQCTQAQLAAWLGMDPTTVTRSVALLRKAGLVAVTAGRADRRTRLLTLTAQGRRQLLETLPRWRQAQASAVALLGGEKAAQLLALLQEFGEAAAAGVDSK